MKKFLFLLASVFACFAINAAEPTVVFSENFDAFTEGTETAPATTDISSFSSGKLGKTLSGWTGKYVYEAGGMLKIADGGNLKTARYSMSANSGIIKISARVRSLSEAGMALSLKVGYTTTKTIYVSNDQWQDIEIVTAGGTSSTQITVTPNYTAEGMLIDNLSVTQSEDFFPAPTANQPNSADGSQFTASWTRVIGATAYLLDVYTKKSETEFEYLLKDESVTLTSKTVTDLDANKTYFFRVRATNGTATSDYSNEIEVVKVITSVTAPKALPATNITTTSFTANWEGVEEATGYILHLYKNSVIDTEGEYTILYDDFSGVKTGSLTDIEFGLSQEDLDAYTQTPGWYGVAHAFAAGYIGLSPYSGAASLTTPYLDLSNNGGKFTVVANMSEQAYGADSEGYVVQFDLINENGDVLETQTATLAKGFQDYTLNFTKGALGTAVKVSYSGSKKLFFDEFTVKQVLPVGYIVKSLVSSTETTATSLDVTVDEAIAKDKLYYSYVAQAGAPTVEDGDIVTIYSDASNEIVVDAALVGVEKNVAAETAKLVRTADGIAVTTAEPTAVKVYSLSGTMLIDTTVSGTASLDLPSRDIVIVKVGNKAVKL